MRSAALAGIIAGAVLVATLVGGPLFSRVTVEKPPVSVVDVDASQVDGTAVIDVRVRNNEGYPLTGEVWYVVISSANADPVYEHQPLSFGPLQPKQSAAVRFDRPAWTLSDEFEIDVWARETFNALVEPAPQLVPSSVTLSEQGIEVTLRDARLDRLRTMRDSARLTLALELSNQGNAAHDYRVIFTLRPAVDPHGVFYQSPFQDVALSSGQSTVLNFEDQVVIAPGDYVLSGWVQVKNKDGLYEHVVKIDSPQILRVGE